MKQFKSFSLVVATLFLLASCGVNDLEDRLDKVEGALGTDEPLKMDFSTTNYDDEVISVKKSFLFKPGGGNEYIEDNQNGTYDVYLERLGSVEWEESAYLEFTYNPETEEITNKYMGGYFYDKYDNDHNIWFAGYYGDNTIDITISSFNPETGKIKVSAVASSESDFDYNTFEGNPMNMTLSFSGKLPLFMEND